MAINKYQKRQKWKRERTKQKQNLSCYLQRHAIQEQQVKQWLEYKSEVYFTLIKFKDLSVRIKFISYFSYSQLILRWNLI